MICLKRLITLLLAVVLFLSLAFPITRVSAANVDSVAGVVTTVSGPLNIRSNPGTDAPVVSFLQKGSYVTLLSKTGAWWKVEYGAGKYGYCHANYITAVESNTASVATRSSALNVRSGPGTMHSVIANLPKGYTAIILSASGGWSKILYHGTKTGYVSSQYLSSGSSAAVKLMVPSFKQTDTRWANAKIGTSGKTMAQIGCATTAIAMIESHRTGVTIFPDAMAKKLTYTASGNVYWPGHYTVNTNPSGYLTRVYELLRQGKPILFGAKNSSGKQHWVVITGYTGGSSLIPSGFLINDPGSSARTNLQQFLNSYPIFYKYFHY